MNGCTFNHTDCFAYMERRDNGCYALSSSIFFQHKDCPFYKPETAELNKDKIEAAITAYRMTHSRATHMTTKGARP